MTIIGYIIGSVIIGFLLSSFTSVILYLSNLPFKDRKEFLMSWVFYSVGIAIVNLVI